MFSLLSPLLRALWHVLWCALVYRAARLAVGVVRLLYMWYVRPALCGGGGADLAGYYSQRWTVVTGGTDGIGKAYALELARRGCTRFCLVGRSADKLAEAKEAIEGLREDAEVRLVEFDLSRSDMADEFPFDELDELDVGILVNSAGIAVDKVAGWLEHPPGVANQILQVNTVAPIMLADRLCRNMTARGTRGLVVNVASVLGWRPQLYTSAYSCSKAALGYATHALAASCVQKGIRVQTLLPIVVATKMTKYADSAADGVTIVRADDYARRAVDVIGARMLTCGTPLMDLALHLLLFLPDIARVQVVRWIFEREKHRFNKTE